MRMAMAVTYEKLWKLLKEKNMKKIEMQRTGKRWKIFHGRCACAKIKGWSCFYYALIIWLATNGAAAKDVPALVKKIDRTTYIVRVHFSKTGKETMSDKIKRMLKNEIQQMWKSDNGNRPGIRNVLAPGL